MNRAVQRRGERRRGMGRSLPQGTEMPPGGRAAPSGAGLSWWQKNVRRVAFAGARRNSYAEFHAATLAIDDAPRSPLGWRVWFAILALLACASIWAVFGVFESYTSAVGKIQSSGRTKVLEAMSPGKVLKIVKSDGDLVAAGDILVELDPTDALAERTIVDQKLTDVRAETLRLKTEIAAARSETIDPATKILWGGDVPDDVKAREDRVANADLSKLAMQIKTLLSQKHAKETERDKYAANIVAQKALVAITQENLAMIESLLKNGYNSQAKYLDMKAQVEDQQVKQTAFEGSLENAKQAIQSVDSEIAKTRETFVTAGIQTIATDDQTSLDLTQQRIKADQKLTNMTLRAPVAGVIHASSVTTIGQVVKPGQQMMQIVPSDAPLEIEAYVPNTDIGFIRVGDPTSIRVTAFAYKTYGSIDGTVTSVSKIALPTIGKGKVQTESLDGEYEGTSASQKTRNLQFPITVRAARSTMTVDGKEIPLVSGMGVDVEIMTERRRAIDFIVSPLEELIGTAGHER